MKFRPLAAIFRQIPLKIVLTIPFLFQVIGSVGVIGYLSFKNGQATANDLASQLRSELTTRIASQIQDTVERPHVINQMNAHALLNQDIQVLSGKGEHQLWRQAQLFPGTNLIYCATESDGALLGVGVDIGDRQNLRIQIVNDDTNRHIHYYAIDPTGRRSHLLMKGTEPLDPRQRPWYVEARSKQQPTWSEIYADFDTQLPTITASTPVYEPVTNALIGVCATDMILSQELNAFLQGLDISESGIAFVVDPSNLLIASSLPNPDPPSNSIAPEGHLELIAATDSPHALIRETTEYLIETYHSLEQVESTQLDFLLDGQRHYLQVMRCQQWLGLDWIVVTVVPEHDFMAQINRNTQVTAILSIIALLFTILVGLMITYGLSQPLLQLSAMARNIARGKWDSAVELNRSDAIGDLSRSFLSMSQQLRDSFTTLEEKIEGRTQELLQANRELEKMARTDGLTQTANRRYFDYYLEVEWKRLIREQGKLTLILCDVDYFKAYNDTYGHQEGDRCLQHLAQILMDATQRPADLVARYGGEEFAIILPNTNTQGAIHIAQRIQATLRTVPLLSSGVSPPKPITVSLGIATIHPSTNTTIYAFIASADKALYAAKANGRNGYFVSPESDAG